MMDVVERPLSEVAEVVRGVTFSKKDASTDAEEGLAPVLRAGNIQGDLLLNQDLVYVSDNLITEKQKLRTHDIVMCTSSGSASVVGKTAYLGHDWNGSFGAFCAVIRTNNGDCWPRYLYHYLQTPQFRSWTKNSGGANIKNIRKSELDSVEIPLPKDIDEQKRIAAILDKADAIRRKREQALALADDFLRSVFLDMFGDPVLNNKKFPDGSVADFEEFITSGSRGWAKYYSDSGDIFLRIGNVGRGKLKLDDLVRVDAPDTAEAKRTRVRSEDVLLSITADLGRTAVVPKELEGAHINQHLAILRLRGISPHYVSAYLSSTGGQRQFKQLDKVGVKSGLNFNDLRSLRILVPSKEMQLKFEHTIQKTETIRLQLLSSLCEANLLFASLSQRAFRGEL